jgi:hypothetical protein
MKYLLRQLNSGTFSTLNLNTAVWSATASGDISGDGLNIPLVTFKGTDVRLPGLYIGGTVSCGNFYANGPWVVSGSIMYKSNRNTTTTITRGTNYQITDITTNQTVLLPASPKIGDYVWYENHNSSGGRFVVTLSGNGINIRSSTNSIAATILQFGLFHYDGTYWNHLYEP